MTVFWLVFLINRIGVCKKSVFPIPTHVMERAGLVFSLATTLQAFQILREWCVFPWENGEAHHKKSRRTSTSGGSFCHAVSVPHGKPDYASPLRKT